nr:U4/U6.U5 tri-snRNP-associated protein 2-like [Ipomoea batatas]
MFTSILRTEKIYCLPDGYEVIDSSLDDIRYVLNPRFSLKQVEQLDNSTQWSRALDGSDYLPWNVNFPVKNLELKDYIPLPSPKDNEKLRSKYDLIANIVHDGKPGEGSYRVFVQRKSEALWFEMQDLHVTETLSHVVALSEAYMQIYEQQQQ